MGTVSWFPQVFDFTFQQPNGKPLKAVANSGFSRTSFLSCLSLLREYCYY
nr:MAG TPA: hypothetical protein [Caudoviricetes sp.]